MKKKSGLLIAVLIIIMLAVTSCGVRGDSSEKESKKAEKKPKAVTISILCAGDVMAHVPNITSAQKSDGTYDFTDNYEYVADYIQEADLALCNMEATFKGGTPTGYPLFNAPDSLADAVKEAGFDAAFTSNNHMMDTGYEGMQRTLKILREAGLKTSGSRLEDEEKSYAVVKVKGVKFGLVGYTYETTQSAGGQPSINGNNISSDSLKLINSFNYHELESEDYDRIQKDMDACRKDGADFVICYLHWGNEYEQSPNKDQQEMAQEIADRGADIIFASHPHVLQEIDVLTSNYDGKKVPVFYSLGNYISNQRTETLSNKYTENGAMGTVTLTVLKETGQLRSESVSVMPTWVDKYSSSGGGLEYRIIPLDGKLSTNKALAASGHFDRAQGAKDYTEELFGEYIKGETIYTAGGSTSGRSKGEGVSSKN